MAMGHVVKNAIDYEEETNLNMYYFTEEENNRVEEWVKAHSVPLCSNFYDYYKEDIKMNEKLHQELLDYIHNLYMTKNKDYGSSVHDTYSKYGFTSFLVRLEDKLNRARVISQQEPTVLDEKLEDTLLDLANYAILAVMELREEKGDK